MNPSEAGGFGNAPSRFSTGCYRGYEVRLRLHRVSEYEPMPLRSPRELYEFMRDLQNEPSEYMYELLMDTKHRVTGVYLVGKGSVDTCPGHATEVFTAALVANSPAFALVHNHPSGVPEPSPDDTSLVRRIERGAEILGLSFLDFVIIGNGSYSSFMEMGLLPRRQV